MSLRRFFTFLLLGLGLIGLIWVAALRLTRPVEDAAQPAPSRRFDLAVAEARAGQPSLVDYGRLDGRIQQLMEDPAMVGLAVAVVENGQIRFVEGFGTVASNSQERVTEHTVFRWASLSKGCLLYTSDAADEL